jgi:hypothetical protein
VLDHVSVAVFMVAREDMVPLGSEDEHFDVDGLIDELTRV